MIKLEPPMVEAIKIALNKSPKPINFSSNTGNVFRGRFELYYALDSESDTIMWYLSRFDRDFYHNNKGTNTLLDMGICKVNGVEKIEQIQKNHPKLYLMERTPVRFYEILTGIVTISP